MMSATTGGFVMMAPYFGYVFWFLEPMNIITRIRSEAVRTTVRGLRDERHRLHRWLRRAPSARWRSSPTSPRNSISGKDKIIASGAVDALKDFTLEYLKKKPTAAEPWFRIGAGIRENPDFVAMDPESLGDLEQRSAPGSSGR